LPPGQAIAAAAAVTAGLATATALTQRPAVPSALTVTLVCVLLGVTGQFIRRSREAQDQTELLLAQLQDAREAEAAAVALAERSRIAGELHDVLAHSLSALALQLQGARKLTEAEPASPRLRAALARSAELARAGLAEARQAVGALRGDRLPSVAQLGALVSDFRRDTGTDVTLQVEGAPRALPAEADLALYRGAQEALTNIARYAPGAAASVKVRYAPERTVLTVENRPRPVTAGEARPDGSPAGGEARPDGSPAGGPGPDASLARGNGPPAAPLAGAGGGHGLAAMRERAQRAGGSAAAGPTAGGWLVEVEVPG
jgi:signal transduction histidine kinase